MNTRFPTRDGLSRHFDDPDEVLGLPPQTPVVTKQAAEPARPGSNGRVVEEHLRKAHGLFGLPDPHND